MPTKPDCMSKKTLMPVMITTKHRGIFIGYVEEGKDLTKKTLKNIKRAKMLIRHQTGKGLQHVAEVGPNDDCHFSTASDIRVLHDVTAVFDVTPAAAAKIWPSNEG